jgi:hypothetical protein
LFSKNGVDFHGGAQKKPQKPHRTGEGSVREDGIPMQTTCKEQDVMF